MFFRLCLSCLFVSLNSVAAEEEIDLAQVEPSPPVAVSIAPSKFKLMGRLDLSAEFGNPNPSAQPQGGNRSTLSNKHLLVFLKISASEKTSVMAEVADQRFFYADYQASLFQVQFGKILVPFGDNRRFHLAYGGIQGYGAQGVMFPNVWSEPGANVIWKFGKGELDTFVVNSIAATSEAVDPDLQSNTDETQALGFRYSHEFLQGWNFIGSAYQTQYREGKDLGLVGLNLYSDYGAVGMPRNFRFAVGFANAFVKKAPVSQDFQIKGDYIELTGKGIGPGELRLRYGTYIHNTKVVSNRNVHNWNIGYIFDVDVLNILLEHQFNLEAVDEIKNDLTRLMVSVNF